MSDNSATIDALKLIIARSPRAAGDAITAIAAARNNSPVLDVRYLRVMQLALNDPDAEFSAAERAQLAEGVPNPGGSEARSYTLHVRMSDDERARLTALAEADGIGLSEYVRRKVLN